MLIELVEPTPHGQTPAAMMFQIGFPGGNQEIAVENPFGGEDICYIVCTYDKQTMKIFINGEKRAESAVLDVPMPPGDELQVGIGSPGLFIPQQKEQMEAGGSPRRYGIMMPVPWVFVTATRNCTAGSKKALSICAGNSDAGGQCIGIRVKKGLTWHICEKAMHIKVCGTLPMVTYDVGVELTNMHI